MLSSFISPLTNQRTDDYGGTLANRLRYPLEVFAAVRQAWPNHLPLSVRISAHDWVEGGITPSDAVDIARAFKAAGADMIDCSSGQVSPLQKPTYGRMYQTPFADRIRQEAGIATIAVGAISEADHVNSILAAGPSRLVCRGPPAFGQPGVDLDRGRSHWVQRLGHGLRLMCRASRNSKRVLPESALCSLRNRPPKEIDMTARHALITGAGSGIGAAIALTSGASGLQAHAVWSITR